MYLVEQLGVPLPADLRFVLQRFNGGELPSGDLLPAGELKLAEEKFTFTSAALGAVTMPVARAAKLLLETTLPVSRVAAACDFPDEKNFARFFRTQKGTSPLKYRREHGTMY